MDDQRRRQHNGSNYKRQSTGNLLVEEMKEMGLSDVSMDEYGYVYGYLPARKEWKM